MQIYLKEKIGNPSLFTGRKKELNQLLKWIDGIKLEISKSKAIISRRKTGKSALMQRLYNILFEQNGQVIPFYFEIKETSKWLVEFANEFFITFICQYIAFQSRNPRYLNYIDSFDQLIKAAKKENLDYLIAHIENFEHAYHRGSIDTLWDLAREAPRTIAAHKDERILQIIDEFQFINRYIYRDKNTEKKISNLAGSYLHTAEYKNAPLLVTGSWVGWLMDDLNKMLPGRFTIADFGNMPRHEAIEMALNYSEIFNIPISYETACIIADLTEGSPFYISSLFQSDYPDKDFSTETGILNVLDFETIDKRGGIRGTWMEYIHSAIDRINDINGKKIVLYLCKNKEKKIKRSQIEKELNLDLKQGELEKRMKALVKSDIIEQGTSYFSYQAVGDNIFDKVFRGVYQEEIDDFDPETIKNEYQLLYRKLQGEFNKYKGQYSEYVIINCLRHRSFKKNAYYTALINNLPKDFCFVEYESIWSYSASPIYKKDIQVDIFAKASNDNDYCLIGEVKNRKAKFSEKEAKTFLAKALEVKKLENVGKALFFVFSSGGFFKNTIQFLKKNHIAWSDDSTFLE
ncbi:ATPase domain protein, prokaryote domain protein [Candidatus Magnetomorum sp. HK-1]|nr:ATPase domain protein, prokaryote domain protein [Candidatus Magnetomorum sp. HK-1]